MRIKSPHLVLFVICGSFLPAPALGEEKKLPLVNARVLKFVQDRIDKQVADGDCWKLADAALTAARARRPGKNGYGVYDFGRELKTYDLILPGDIVQFSGARFASRDGTRFEMKQHTAIVAQVDGSTVEILHQNWNGVRYVTRLRIDLADLRTGKASFFRPQPATR
jgi:hypothetical protein